MARIGVYICHCGTNIRGTVDVEKVRDYVKNLEGVVIARDYRYMCSDPGQELIKKDIKEHGLTGVVVAACSPRMHEGTFRRACEEAGLNPYLFEMANIREQCSWVHEDIDAATEKAKALVRAAVRKVLLDSPLHPREVSVNPSVLIIGGGIAGIQAALNIAEAGKKVYLVEKSPSIGGHMAQLDKTFPTLDCSACILTPKMTDVGAHPNIELMTWSEVEEVSGFVGNFKVKVRKKARFVDMEKCIGCGICMEKCPWKTKSEFDEGLSERKAIYTPFPQAVPNVPVIDKEVCVYFKTGKCRACEKFCPTGAIKFDDEDEIVELDVGAIIVATGYNLMDPSRLPEYGYGVYDNVITSLQFERLVNAQGPTGGRILLKDGREPESIAILHCIGSRDENYNKYCSRVCCMYALKFSHLIREKVPGADIYEFYIDMRCVGKEFEEFYHRLLGEGVKFIRGKAVKVTDRAISDEEKGKLIVIAEDTLINKVVRVPVDMVILCLAIEPREDAQDIARKLNIQRSRDGFFLEKHPKLEPVSTSTDGVFLAGCCQGPKDIPETVAQASAAASHALALIDKGKIILEPITAEVVEELCSGCQVCVNLCPFGAITFDPEKRKSSINEVLCKACGVCAAACPSGAIVSKHFTTDQVFAEIEGLLK